MCGIAGIIGRRGTAVGAEQAETISRLLAHRGPDDHGFLALTAEGAVSRARTAAAAADRSRLFLIHRRLSILDLSEGGWQPMATQDGAVQIVFNGEIYNFIELRAELEALGHTFHTTSDTEVLLAAYEEWGDAAFARFVGMFAMAILDLRLRRIRLVRDFFGIKPLYYCRWEGGVAFASEVRPLLTLPGVPRDVDARAAYFYLRYGVTDQDESTLFSSVRQVPPAHYFDVDLDEPVIAAPKRYWSLDPQPESALSYPEAAAKLRDLFVESVSMHLRSDVPVGAALSGGIDSAAVVMAMREIVGERLDLHTFSYIADDPAVSEETWMAIAAKASGATRHDIRVSRDEFLADLPQLMAAHDQPFASTSIYAQFRVFRHAKENGITVMLDGQGADEMLAGYRPFLGARLASMLRRGELASALRFTRSATAMPGVTSSFLVKTAIETMIPEWLQPLARSVGRRELMPAWLDARWFADRGIRGAVLSRGAGRGALAAALDASRTNVLPSLLRYEDRNSMHFSIESRVPFLTPKLAAFIASLPESYIVSDDGVTKSVFRSAMRGLVPDAILDRKDKVGFVTPEASWLTGPAGAVTALVDRAPAVPLLDAASLRAEIDAVRSRRIPFHNGIWRALNLVSWSEVQGAVFR